MDLNLVDVATVVMEMFGWWMGMPNPTGK